jgi:signal transduction histidine kinase
MRSRAAVPAVAATAIIVLAGLSLNQAANRVSEVRLELEDTLSGQLVTQVESWEDSLLAVLEEIVDDVRSGVDIPKTEEQRRKRHAWFDSAYVWSLPTDIDTLERSYDTQWTYPYARDPGGAAVSSKTCAQEVHTSLAPKSFDLDPAEALALADRLRSSCDGQPLAERAYVSFETARFLIDRGQPEDAKRLLHVPGFDDRTPWSTGTGIGEDDVPISLRVERRLLDGRIRLALGDPSGEDFIRSTVRIATNLDVPALRVVLHLLENAELELAGRGTDTLDLQEDLLDARRRLDGFQTLDNLAPRIARQASVPPDFEVGLGDDPMVLYVVPPSLPGEAGIALMLDRRKLIEDFLERSAGVYREQLAVTDITQRVILGPRDTSDLAVTTTFQRTMPGISVGLPEPYVARRVAILSDSGVFWNKLITVLCAMLGAGALVAQVRAEQRHRVLLQRQREFTTRVTHELKTPLAGIRVMAENLAMGAFRDDHHRTEMEERIVDEADRLTARVEEILRVARDEALPDPEPVDLEEILMELLDAWIPRYQQSRVTLVADFDVTDPVMGLYDALRDAIGCLLDNALKYRREGIESKVWLYLRASGRWVDVEVVDNGLGVPREHRRDIFEAFVRVEGDNRGKAGGHGLGLAQVARVAKNHRGSVRCEDGVDGGSRFVLRIPAGPTT